MFWMNSETERERVETLAHDLQLYILARFLRECSLWREKKRGRKKWERRKVILTRRTSIDSASFVLYKTASLTHKKESKNKMKNEKFSLHSERWYSQKNTFRASVFAGLSLPLVNKWVWLAVAPYWNACEQKGKEFFGVEENWERTNA